MQIFGFPVCYQNVNIKLYRTVSWSVVLCGCGTLSRALLRDKRRLWVFENRVVRETFGTKRDEVTGEWRRLVNEELNDLYCAQILFE